MLLCVIMVVTLFTGMLPAASADSSAGEMTAEGVKLNKTLSLSSDGTYTIKLEAFATGEIKTETVTESIPTDFILVVDQSGSMSDSMRVPTLTKPSTNITYGDLCHGGVSDPEPCTDGNGSFPYYYRADATDAAKFDGVVAGHDYIMYYTASYKPLAVAFQYNFYIYCPEANQLYLVADFLHTSTVKITRDERNFYEHLYFGSKDSSSNRLDSLVSAANAFVSKVKADSDANGNLNHRVAVVGFSTNGFKNTELLTGVTIERASQINDNNSKYYPDGYAHNGAQYGSITNAQYAAALQDISTSAGKTSVDNAINALTAHGGTEPDKGLDMAKQILANRSVTTFTTASGKTENRNTVIVFFTDGEPDSNRIANSAITTASSIKSTYNTKIYSVGVFTNPSQAVHTFMQGVSSNYAGGTSRDDIGNKVGSKYYINAFDAKELVSVFSSITSDINHNTTSCVLDSTSILKDVISENLDLSSATKVTTASVKYGSTAKAVNNITFSDFTGATSTVGTATINKETKTIDASGFDYSSNYVTGAANTGSKFVVTITGLVPNKAGNDLYSNTTASGIYDKDTSGNYIQVAQFGMPTFSIAEKNYVIDYAKPLKVKASDFNQSSISISGDFVKGSATNTEFGTVSSDGSNIIFTPTTMNWTGSDSVCSFGQSSGAYSWAKVNFVPANNVYYEDTFVSTDGNGIEYVGTWTTDVSSASNNVGTANTDITAGSWKNAALGDDKTYSDGSAHMAVASKDNRATASFTFTGTGVDVYSRTNETTGTIFATIKGGSVNKAVSIDNKLEGKNFYQVPTLSFSGLPYDTYTVTIYVTTAAGAGRATYYLDGIRVYNPANFNEDSNYPETERRAQFTEVRDSILEANAFSVDASVEGAVFVDTKTSGATVADYKAYGPENEVYLAKGQAIVFNVGTTGNTYYVGLSSPEGQAAAAVTNDSAASNITVGHASDLYYKITPNSDGYIMIKNTSDNILAVSKLYTSGSEPMMLRSMSYAPTMSYVNSFSTLSVVPYEEETVVNPDPTNPADPTDPVDTQPATIIKAIVDSLFRSIKNLFKWF